MDVLWKQLADLNAAADAARERRINLQHLRCEFMRLIHHGSAHKNFKGELIKLKDLQRNLEEMRDTTRQTINDAVRPFLRSLKILDLPDEILRDIFLWVREDTFTFEVGFDDWIWTEIQGFDEPDVKQVMKLRLTCRRFCATSSHLLMPYVKVDTTPQSLARLDAVSRHQTISKGIRRVEIFLGYHFDADIAHDIRAFARYQANQLRSRISMWETGLRGSFDFEMETFRKAIDRGTTIAESFEDAAQNGLDENRPEHIMLREAQECYIPQYESQMLLHRGPFAQVIVSALLRMPTATCLSIQDEGIFKAISGPDHFYELRQPEDLEDVDTLRRNLQAPIFSWRWARCLGLGSPPFDAIPNILLSIGEAGICLNRLEIDVSWPDKLSSFATGQVELLKRQASSQQLKEFKFCPHHVKRLPIKAVSHLADTLPTILHIYSLRTIDLCFDFMYKGESIAHPIVSMAPILLSYTWPSLEEMSFNGPFYLEDLIKVVNHIGKHVKLQWCGYLMDGSWAEVLDFLRGCEQRTMITLGDRAVSIAGAECESMSFTELLFIFRENFSRRRLWSESRALSYIRGWTTQNPVTDWENGELSTTEDEEMDDEEIESDELGDDEMGDHGMENEEH